MNYYAIVGALARVYSWAGELENAYNAASEIINATSCFNFNSSSAFSSNRKLYEELFLFYPKKHLLKNLKFIFQVTQAVALQVLFVSTFIKSAGRAGNNLCSV